MYSVCAACRRWRWPWAGATGRSSRRPTKPSPTTCSGRSAKEFFVFIYCETILSVLWLFWLLEVLQIRVTLMRIQIQLFTLLRVRVRIQRPKINADSDSTFHFTADTEPASKNNANPASKYNADPDPQPYYSIPFSLAEIEWCLYVNSRSFFRCVEPWPRVYTSWGSSSVRRSPPRISSPFSMDSSRYKQLHNQLNSNCVIKVPLLA